MNLNLRLGGDVSESVIRTTVLPETSLTHEGAGSIRLEYLLYGAGIRVLLCWPRSRRRSCELGDAYEMRKHNFRSSRRRSHQPRSATTFVEAETCDDNTMVEKNTVR